MKKMLFVLGLFLSCAFMYAQQASLTDAAKPKLNHEKQSTLKNVSPENVVPREHLPVRKSDQPTKPNSVSQLSDAKAHFVPETRAVIFSEGFEGTTMPNLPTGWTKSSSATNWKTMDDFANEPALGDPFPAHTGTRMMGNVWNTPGPNWAFSPGFALVAGNTYTISFWWNAMGYPMYSEPDDFEVRIGTTPTPGGMSGAHQVFKHPNIVYNFDFVWRNHTTTFTPTTSGTFHLGFLDLRPTIYGEWGLCIAIDDILITGEDGPNPDCDPATNLNIAFADDCSKATLTWNEPAKGKSTLLWDNTNINIPVSGNNGLISTHWSGSNNWVYTADDFDADGAWTIERVISQGFSNAPSPLPTKFAIVIYANNAGKPGTEIYRNNSINVTDGADPVINLPTPFTLPGAGKYWISIAGTYDVNTPGNVDDYRWNVYSGTTGVGINFHLHDPANLFGMGTAWFDAGPVVSPLKSMYFKIEGTSGGPIPGDYAYNVYRDGTKLNATPITTPTFEDNTFTAGVEYTWSVKVACEGGGESAPVSKTDMCDNGDCNGPTNLNVAYNAPTCNEAVLTWTAPAAKGAEAVIFDNVEGHTAWTINSPGSIPWSYYNGNGGSTYGAAAWTFPGSGSPMAFIVFNPTQTTPPVTDFPAYSGSQYFACFNPMSGLANGWIISPEFSSVESGATISFYARSLTNQYGAERFKVSISTTGSAHNNFTTVISPGNYVTTTESWVQYSYTIPTNAKYVAITCVSDDAFALFIDDIAISGINGGTTPLLYNVYRDGVQIGTSTTTTFTAPIPDPTAAYTWSVRAVCEGGGLSAAASKPMDPCGSLECDPVTDINLTVVAGGIRVCWTMPTKKPEVTITQSHAAGTGVIGSTGSLSFGVYNRFRPEDLVAVNNGELTKFVFIPGMGDTQGGVPRHDYTIRIYQGGTWGPNASDRNPGTLIFSQALNNSELDFDSGMDNIITLNEPIIIDATKELWIGYWCQATSPGGYPALTDIGPRKSGLGDVMNFQGWTTLYDVLSSSPYNWYMQGKVQVSIPTVNIYFNGTKIANEIEGTCWQHANPPLPANVPYPWCYQVEVNCVNGATSPMSDCENYVSIKENVKTGFSIAPNPATNSITVSAENNFHTIEVVSFLGQTVLAQPNAGNATTLDVSNLTNGVYFVRIISDNGTSVKKFVKQ